jgi:hypothetical protein
MTTEELRAYLNKTYGLENAWPTTMQVDADTYGHVANSLIKHKLGNEDKVIMHGFPIVSLTTGRNGGLMYKGVELIL